MIARCNLGAGCDEAGVCFADAHGEPSQCGRIDLDDERAKANKDSQLLGMGFLVDGMHVDASRVTILRNAHWPHVTSTDLHDALAKVLRDKGASDDWVAYVMGDLQVAASQYAHDQWVRGHEAATRGEPVPNPQGDMT